MSVQKSVNEWLEQVKEILKKSPEQTWVSVPLLQNWLLCSYSQALMVRDAMIKAGIIGKDAQGIRYYLTPAYLSADTQGASAQPDATPEPPRSANEDKRRTEKSTHYTINDITMLSLALNAKETDIFNQMTIHGGFTRPGGAGSTMESLADEHQREALRCLLRMEANGLVVCENDTFFLCVHRKDAGVICSLSKLWENFWDENNEATPKALRLVTATQEEIRAFIEKYDALGMQACGEDVSRVDWGKYENYLAMTTQAMSATDTDEHKDATDPTPPLASVEDMGEATVSEEDDGQATSEESLTQPPQTHVEQPQPSTSPTPATPPRKEAVSKGTEIFSEEVIARYKSVDVRMTAVVCLWQDMLIHLCAKGFNEITEKYVPTLMEKTVLPPTLAAYLMEHPLTPETACLPMCAAEMQDTFDHFGVYAVMELIWEKPDLTKNEILDVMGERIRCLRNMFILSNVAVDSYQAARNVIRNDSEERFNMLKKQICEEA